MGKLDRIKDKQPIRDKKQCNLRLDDDICEMIRELKTTKDILGHLRQVVSREVRDVYAEYTQR